MPPKAPEPSELVVVVSPFVPVMVPNEPQPIIIALIKASTNIFIVFIVIRYFRDDK
jgi:hypothetical protein